MSACLPFSVYPPSQWKSARTTSLDKLPKSVQPAAKSDLREIWKAPDRATAEAAIATFAEKYTAKYNKAVTCLVKDRDALLTRIIHRR